MSNNICDNQFVFDDMANSLQKRVTSYKAGWKEDVGMFNDLMHQFVNYTPDSLCAPANFLLHLNL